MKIRSYLKNTILLIVSSAIALALLEMGLRLFTPFPITRTSNTIEDSRLGYTLSPALEDVDELGFRNTKYKLEDVDLVVIGDSHTYGYNVESKDSFPSILADSTGRKVYNLGVGSYGIYQYKVLLNDMAQYTVRDVILALYPANDLALHCAAVSTDYWENFINNNRLSVPDCNTSKLQQRSNSEEQEIGVLRRLIYATATHQIITHLRKRVGNLPPDGVGLDDDEVFSFDNNQFVTKERVRRHARFSNLEDSDVHTNFENSKTFFIEGKEKLTSASVRFVVLIIPSKARVLYEWMKGRNREVPDELEKLIQNEISLTLAYKAFFETREIAYVDSLPDVVSGLNKTLKAGKDFYKAGDGHPYRPGYKAYSDAALKALERISDAKTE